ncbi:hypothetical protein [Ornithinimicrobium sp. INDO-MA30-4]|uniref:hypothetical protein n=1 Tax=Ornithinimicrobium sp. INDO-MA30-4 TaxID=2908651 RepID=UPI0028834DC1|nr:hypothetical protein [Ornithinimicrobium sp. INDO-MA30-4]
MAQVLREAVSEPAVVPVVTDYLSGVLPQRRIGVSWRSLRELPPPAHQPNLGVAEVDQTFSAIGQCGVLAPSLCGVRRWMCCLLVPRQRNRSGCGAFDG